jgi:predicted transcriptional regulator
MDMTPREFIQRYIIEKYDGGNMYHAIDLAEKIYNVIDETLTKPVASTDLWKNQQK